MNFYAAVLAGAVVIGFGSGARAELAWESTQLDLHPKPTEETAVGVFKYANKGDKPIHFNSVRTSCGCTVAAMQKNDVAPGEKGEITATFKIGDRTGVQVKSVTVDTDDAKQPVTVLTMKTTIAQFLDLQPAFVLWDGGEAVKAKTITAKAGEGITLKNVEVTSSTPEFTTKVESVSAGEYRINVQPRDTAHPIFATLTIKADGAAAGAKTYYASARVNAPAAAPPH